MKALPHFHNVFDTAHLSIKSKIQFSMLSGSLEQGTHYLEDMLTRASNLEDGLRMALEETNQLLQEAMTITGARDPPVTAALEEKVKTLQDTLAAQSNVKKR
jgi:hypothetical protein